VAADQDNRGRAPVRRGGRSQPVACRRGYEGDGKEHCSPGRCAHRTRDRAHENRWPSVALLAERDIRRCHLRRPLRLRPQHPQDPRPPQGFAGLHPGRHIRRHPAEDQDTNRQSRRPIALFSLNYLVCFPKFRLCEEF